MRRKPEIRAGRNDPPRPNGIGEWRSPVARLLWEQDVAGSNPVSPTILFTTHVPQISAPTVRGCTQVIIPPSAGKRLRSESPCRFRYRFRKQRKRFGT